MTETLVKIILDKKLKQHKNFLATEISDSENEVWIDFLSTIKNYIDEYDNTKKYKDVMTPKKPFDVRFDNEEYNYKYAFCPVCNCYVDNESYKFCKNCGQAIDWS